MHAWFSTSEYVMHTCLFQSVLCNHLHLVYNKWINKYIKANNAHIDSSKKKPHILIMSDAYSSNKHIIINQSQSVIK